MDEELNLAKDILRSGETGESVETRLTTNERVLARITDGIYRQPASALRELISNAYDADATEVIILTDAPRFSSIIVRDNGLGLTPGSLAHMIKNIGGSAKRTKEGQELEISNADDPSLSPGGRQLIGKLGIGLFAVAQFTRHFLIITKRKGDKFRTVADITLGPMNNDQQLQHYDRNSEPEIETGHAVIFRELVTGEDVDSQGTEIKLLNLLPRTRAELASKDLWAKIDYEKAEDGKSTSPEPRLHIGRISPDNPEELLKPPNLPWKDEDTSDEKFQNLVDCVRRLADSDRALVDLESICDRYLQTIWMLALWVPLPYLDIHPFDLKSSVDLRFFMLDNSSRGQANDLRLRNSQSLRDKLKLKAPDIKQGDSFKVEIDGVCITRPILFRDPARTSTAITTPILCIGQCREVFPNKPMELSGGPLEFEAYLLWTPKVVPTQHQGVMVRVGNASGAGFDRTFMGYQISEQTRLRQITAEIFVREGFDGAINIDRESYNFAHPHYQYLVKWLHSALRQLTNRHKEVGKWIRNQKLISEGTKTRAALEQKVTDLLKARGVEDLPEVILLESSEKASAEKLRHSGTVVLNKEIVARPPSSTRQTGQEMARMELGEKKAVAIAQILESWGLLKGLTYNEQDQLIREIIEITFFGGKE